MMKTLVAGPYVGELGWEIICWQPMIRNMFLSGEFEKCVVFSGSGRTLLYRFAETRVLPGIPKHEGECLAWHDLQNHMDDLNKVISSVKNMAVREFGPDVNIFTYENLPRLNYEFYERGQPDLLFGNENKEQTISRLELEVDPSKKNLVLCIRDRDLGSFRNWEPAGWFDLVDMLVEKYNVIVTGIVQKHPWEWPKGINDLTNKTTIDDCINLFSNVCDLAIGTTGTIHLASRCASPHLVWGDRKTVIRVAEANWFGAPFTVCPCGWEPNPKMILDKTNTFFETGELV